MNVKHPMGALPSFSIKNIFYDEMDLSLFYFRVTICIFGDMIIMKNFRVSYLRFLSKIFMMKWT